MSVLPKPILDRVSIKNVKRNIGHDLGGLYCEICFDGKKVAYYNDDGYGGETEIEPFDKKGAEMMKSLEDFLNEQNFTQFQYEEEKKRFAEEYLTAPEDMKLKEQLEFICERLELLHSLKRKMKGAILFGNPFAGSYRSISWGKIKSLDEIVEKYGKKVLVDAIKEVKEKMVEGEVIYNTNIYEYIEEA